jgi:hypothetical protein
MVHAARCTMGFEGLNFDGFFYFHDTRFSQQLRASPEKPQQALRNKIERA